MCEAFRKNVEASGLKKMVYGIQQPGFYLQRHNANAVLVSQQ